MVNDFVVSVIRTVIPAIVGAAATWLVSVAGVELDTAGLTSALVGAATGLYYALARTLERRWPRFGWLLGYPKAPQYDLAA